MQWDISWRLLKFACHEMRDPGDWLLVRDVEVSSRKHLNHRGQPEIDSRLKFQVHANHIKLTEQTWYREGVFHEKYTTLSVDVNP